MHTKEELTPILLDVFDRTRRALPPEIAQRLTSSRAVRNHGSYRSFYLFNVWDIHQPDLLHPNHFCYCFGYHGSQSLRDQKNDGFTWFLHLWINTVRLYRNQEEIRAYLETEVQEACPKPFQFKATDRFVEAKHSFEFNQPLAQLPAFLTPRYASLIGALHPVLMPIIDSFSQPLTKEERRAVILSRDKRYWGPATRPERAKVREYTRSIPRTWRTSILQKHGHKCVHCRVELDVTTAHMDHIIPFSKGGATTLENLQPLCGPCNLSKGNRSRN